MNLVRAEWTKLLTTKVGYWLVVAGCLMAGGFTALFIAFAGEPGSGLPAVGTPEFATTIATMPANAVGIALVLGIIGMTQEYRHRTATPTFLMTPRRGRAVIAKLVAMAGAGAVLAVATVVVVVVIVVGYGSARGGTPDLDGDALGVLVRAGLAVVVYAVLGVGIGALVRNQVAAVVGGLVYLYVVEPVLRGIPATADAYRWLPGGATEAITGTLQESDLLTTWQGGLMLLGYGLVAAVLGTVLAVRRDVV